MIVSEKMENSARREFRGICRRFLREALADSRINQV